MYKNILFQETLKVHAQKWIVSRKFDITSKTTVKSQ